MNNILMCRVWDKVDNAYWSEKTIKANAEWLLFPNDNIENVIVERSTGLKDKNGNLIYEGDVVKFGAFGLSRGVVKFGEYENWMPCGDENVYCSCVGWYLDDGYGTYPLNNDQLEIIGNIHETKDNK